MEDRREVIVVVSLRPNDVYTPFQWDRHNLARWVVAITLCWIFYDLFKNGLDTLRSFPDSGSIIAILVVLATFILFALLLFPYLRVRARFREAPKLRKIVKYAFGVEGMRFESEDSNGTIGWSAFDRVVETRKVFALSHVYIPKRCFTSGSDITILRQLIRENFKVKGKCHLRSD